MFLAGDVGGTKIRLALFEQSGFKLKRLVTEKFESRSTSSLGELLFDFLQRNNATTVSAACVAVAGPVLGGKVKMPNLGWELSEQALSEQARVPRLRLANDVAATAAAIPHLEDSDLVALHPGEPPRRPSPRDDVVRGVVAPGTGLGEAYLITNGGRNFPFATEGGHTDFAPSNEVEDGLLRYLRKKLGHVSVERVISGQGIVNIYEYLRDEHLYSESPELCAEMAASKDRASLIAQRAESNASPICVKALDVFVELLGAECGNFMLKLMALGGIYLGGGIPPKILKKLQDGSIIHSYTSKGRFEGVVRAIPLYVIKDDHAALLGAAHIASSI